LSKGKRTGLAFLIILALVILFFMLKVVFWPLLGGVLLSYLLYPLVAFLEKKGLKTSIAVLIIYILVFSLLAISIYVLVPIISNETAELANLLPSYLENWLQRTAGWLPNDGFWAWLLPKDANENLVTHIITSLQTAFGKWLERNWRILPTWAGNIVGIIFVPVISFYLLRDREILQRRFFALLTPGKRNFVLDISGDIHQLLRQFVQGYCLVAIIVGVIFSLFLAFLGVNYAIVSGLLLIIGELVPYFGPFMAAIPVAVLSLLQGSGALLKAGIAFFIVQQLESLVITPRIMGNSLALHPLVVIIAVLCGGYWFGIPGLVLAVPVAAIFKLVLGRLYVFFAANGKSKALGVSNNTNIAVKGKNINKNKPAEEKEG